MRIRLLYNNRRKTVYSTNGFAETFHSHATKQCRRRLCSGYAGSNKFWKIDVQKRAVQTDDDVSFVRTGQKTTTNTLVVCARELCRQMTNGRTVCVVRAVSRKRTGGWTKKKHRIIRSAQYNTRAYAGNATFVDVRLVRIRHVHTVTYSRRAYTNG